MGEKKKQKLVKYVQAIEFGRRNFYINLPREVVDTAKVRKGEYFRISVEGEQISITRVGEGG